MRRFLTLFRHFLHERRLYLFYAYDPKPGLGQTDPCVKVYDSWGDVPLAFRKRAVPSPWMNAMFYRLKRGEAKLLCFSEDGQRLDAYGWVQEWRPFQRRFRAIARTGTMLGPYWTAPEARGKGLYGRLLAYSLSLCSTESPVLIYTSPENLASQRGIEKAGFHPLGKWELEVWLGCFVNFRKVSSL